MTNAAGIERDFYRTLNSFVEPWVRAGVGAPALAPTGLFVLETIGRKTGQPTRTPLVAALVGRAVVAGTFRGLRSQWIRNAIANPSVRYWLGGHEYAGVATIIRVGTAEDTAQVTADTKDFVDGVLVPATKLGWAFAVIQPAVHD